MKNLFKIFSVVAIVGVLSLQSCETTELDLRENPNALSKDQASPDFLMNQVQLSFASWVESFGNIGAELARIDYHSGRTYENNFSPSTFDGRWSSAYAGMFEDIKALAPLAEEGGLDTHLGISKFIKAYVAITLVDYFGDVPFSEANLGGENFNPSADAGATVYASAMALIDEAIGHFNAGGPAVANDFYFSGDADAWVKACNTLKLKALMTSRLVDSGAVSAFNSIISGGNYIASSADDMQFTWGIEALQPDSRHPRYRSDYTATGGGYYQSIHLMNYMLENDDPRRRYYFYRQNAETPGQDGAAPALETLGCSLQEAPAHYDGFPFCGLSDGYWGRDHGNDEGIPPDGFLRTIHGVYPAAGRFDDSTFEGSLQGDGGKGAGVTPIMLASSVDFWTAEAALLGGDAAAAKTAMLAGLAKSVAKVQGFASLDPTADDSFAPDAAAVTAHADAVAAAFDAAVTAGEADGWWNVLAQEFFVSLFGNGSDAYNFYRRTGYPNNLQPNLEPNPGAFIRSMWYPANYTNTNSSASQKPDVSQTVFWDTGATSLY